MGFDHGPYDRRVDAGLLNFSRLILMREEMVRHGDGEKPLWGSNFGWNHLPDELDWAAVDLGQRDRQKSRRVIRGKRTNARRRNGPGSAG